MKYWIVAMVLAQSAAAFAQGSTMKPGLWEMKPIRQVVDGQDMTAQMASAQAEMRQAMASMSPAQRKQMEAMMAGQGMPAQNAAGGAMRICISPAMAARNTPMVDAEGRCEPAKLNHSGNKTSFEFNCTANGSSQVGKGESVASGDAVTTRLDMTTTDAHGRHTLHSETQMKYLGSDCQGVKPADQLSKAAQDSPRKK